MQPGGLRLGELLVAAGLATREQVVEALEAAQRGTDRRLGQLLVDLGSIDERDLARVIAEQHDLEMVDLRQFTPAPGATELMTEAMARALKAIPLSVDDETVTVAVADPSPAILLSLAGVLGRRVTARVAAQSDILRSIANSYRALSKVDSQVRAFEAHSPLQAHLGELETGASAEDTPVVQVVGLMITQGLRDGASDIHIEPHGEQVRVRYRIDGALHDVLALPSAMGPSIVSRLKILAGMNIVERRRPQDGQITMDVEGREVDIRVSTTAVIDGEKVVLRLLDKSRSALQLSELGMPEDLVRAYTSLLRSPFGMVIAAGPTGSGKTTTLYGSLSEINSPERNVMTIEDPVEYTFPLINQIQINEAAGITFAGGLKSILRQDPDIIMVGEVRDVDTARIAVQSALTGHLVLSSLHATDAVSALHRLLDMGIESFLVASAITGVLAQRLMRRICENCAVTYEPQDDELAFLQTMGGSPPPGGFVRGTGCNFCAHSGYRGRIGVYELLPVTGPIRELILAHASHDDLLRVARSEGMRTLQESAIDLVEAGVTTLAEVLRSIYVAGL